MIGKKININIIHKLLGHVLETMIRQIAKYYSMELEGKFDTCEDCALAKVWQKNLGHINFLKEVKIQKRDYLLISHQLKNQVWVEQNFDCSLWMIQLIFASQVF